MIMATKTIGQDNMSQKTTPVFLLSAIIMFSSCSSEENQVVNAFDADNHTVSYCKAFMNVSTEKYTDEGTTRASENWSDGATIYVTLKGDNTKNDGRIVYNKDDDSWTLHYDGILPNGDYTGEAYYIKGTNKADNNALSFNSKNPVYVDTNIKCQRKSESAWITVMLHPQTGRIRFHGTADKSIKISGVWSYTSFDIPNKLLSTSQTPISLTINADGYTPYCYCSFPQTSRTMNVAYDNLLFTTACEHPILDAAQAGYMELPTEENHNGWEMTMISLPSVSDVTVSGVGTHQAICSSSILDNGNTSISDCGFCYSTTANPTIDDMRVSYGKPAGNTFSKNITGLTENTTYHVRAYAINELGVAYGKDKEFTTVAITLPTLSSVTVNGKEGEGEADFSAVITSDGNGIITECGFVYSTHEMPTLTDNKILSESKQNLTSSVKNLKVGTRYYVRAFATNEKGTAYGQQISFIAGGGKPDEGDINKPII